MLKHLKNYREYLTIVVALLVFFVSPYVLRWVDPTAGAYDIGIMQIPVIAAMNFFLYCFTAWFTINLLWPDVRTFFNDQFSNAFNKITAWQKLKLSVCLLCFFLLCMVLLSRGM